MQANKKKKTDPELLRQIASYETNNEEIEAVFSLALPMKKLLDPAQVVETTHQVLKRAEKVVGSKAKDVNIFKNVGSFVVSGDASFIRQIIDDPDIASAVANKHPKKISK